MPKLDGKQLLMGDIETTGFLERLEDQEDFHVCSLTELDENNKEERSWPITNCDKAMDVFADPNVILVMHNGMAYDGPAMEKMTKRKVQAEIIDTLFLSWYLYPKMRLHGLAAWGEEFGVPKPEVDDWEGLTLKEYIHRCDEDVRIQTKLWKQIWKHMMLLYDNNEEAVWRCIRHLNLKAKQAAMQQESRWKIDFHKAEKYQGEWSEAVQLSKADLQLGMPPVPIMKKKEKPAKCFKGNGKLSAHGIKWFKLLKEQGLPLDYEGVVTYQDGVKDPNAGSSKQMKDWLFSMGWVPESFDHKRDKETGEIRKIPQIKNDEGLLCRSVERLIPQQPALSHLQDLSIYNHRLSIVKGFLDRCDEKGYIVAAIQGLTNTLRFKHKTAVNLPSTRKKLGEEIRGLLMARSSKTELCGSDMSSLEDRTKQHYMWVYDPEYVKDMMADDFDPHCDMAVAAKMMTPQQAHFYKNFDKENATAADKKRHEELALIRHSGKSCNYAATYGAGAETIARSAGVPESIGAKLHRAYWERNWSLTAIADNCKTKKSRGMSWLWNPVAKLWLPLRNEKDKFSTLNQSTGTYAFDRWVYHILRRRPQLTAQFHDEVILELAVGNQEAMTKILKDAIADVNGELKLNRALDCDVDFGRNYAQIH